MRSRILVAVIGLPLLYVALLLEWRDQLVFALLVTAAMALAMLEACTLLRRLHPFVPASLACAVLAPLLAWRIEEPGLLLALVPLLPLTLAFHGLSAERPDPLASIMATFAPVAWILPAAGLVVVLRDAPEGFGLVTLLIASVFINDAGAYAVGKLIGRHRLAPRISPGKSIEGFVGGVVAGTVTMWFGHWLVLDQERAMVLQGSEAVGIGLAVALAAPTGDLFESLVKRSAGVKDSGRLLGEHGGMLDRVDALLVAIPVMYVGCFLVGAL